MMYKDTNMHWYIMNPHIDDEESEISKNNDSDKCRETLFLWAGFLMIVFLALMIAFGLASCTITQTMTHVDGASSESLDETATTSPDVTPTTSLTIPVKAI